MKSLIVCLLLLVPVAAIATPSLEAPPVADTRGLPPIVVDAPADPLAVPAESISRVAELWRSGAIPSAIIVAAFFVLVVLRARVPWFSEHGRAAWVAAAIGGLTVLVDCIQAGQTPNLSTWIVALTTALALAARMPADSATTKG